MQVKEVILKTTQFFRDKGFESPRLDCELLMAKALKWERMKLYLNYEYPLSEAELSSCRELVRRRGQGEPVAYILGSKDFYNHSFRVSPAVLIPRPETEMIVERCAEWLKKQTDLEAPRIVDFGTGSGCIGLSVLAEAPTAQFLGVDISAEAIQVAEENASVLGFSNRAKFLCQSVSDLTSQIVGNALGGLADAIVANPPYIAVDSADVQTMVKKFEPQSALFSEESGLGHIRAWASKAGELSRAGAFVMFEIGYDQGAMASKIFSDCGLFKDIKIEKDLSGHDRFIRALRA
jgi:release factor glutamine methyltransferase